MPTNPVKAYLSATRHAKIDSGFLAYIANLAEVSKVAPQVAASIVKELSDQRSNLKLIASENYCSLSTQCAMANLLTDKYAEGIPRHRFYAGCGNVDDVEEYAAQQACKLFGCDHENNGPGAAGKFRRLPGSPEWPCPCLWRIRGKSWG